jgi:hypothetical protein
MKVKPPHSPVVACDELTPSLMDGAVYMATRLLPLPSRTLTEVVIDVILPAQAREVDRQGSMTSKVKEVELKMLVCGAGRKPESSTE